MSRRRDTEARVLERAERLFVRRGYAATSVRDIAAEAGVSVGTVVSVGGKAELFVRCMERRATADAVAALEGHEDLPGALRALVAATPGLTARGGELTRDYLAALLTASASADNDERLRDVVGRLAARWAEHLGTTADDPRARLRARAFYTSLVGSVFAVASGQLDRREAAELMEQLIDEETAPLRERGRR